LLEQLGISVASESDGSLPAEGLTCGGLPDTLWQVADKNPQVTEVVR